MELSREDRVWSRAVRRYREARLELVEEILGEPYLTAFRSFCEIWVGRYTWDDDGRLRGYLALDRPRRGELFRRFAREARLWEATLRVRGRPERMPALREQSSGGPEGSWRQRLREMREREERMRSFWDRLAGRAAEHRRGLGLSWDVREAFRELGLPAGSSLEVVRRTYRRLALVHHPDRSGDHRTMATLNRAYRRIKDHYG